MNVEGLRDRLRRAGIEPTPRELAETLWLAARIAPATAPAEPAVTVPADPGAPGPPVPRRVVPPPAATPPALAPMEPPPRAPVHVELHPDRPALPPARPAEPVEVPKPIALSERLAFQRALRPLLRRVPVRGIGTLDEEATARYAAEHPVGSPWPPVLTSPRELWLDAVVVVDRSDSMAIWQDLAAEVVAALTESGVFRQVRRYRLEGGDGSATLTDWRGRPRRGAELVDPVNRRVILVISDGVGRMWRSGAAGALLHEWGGRGPVAILQPLPERLWSRTGARTVAGRLAAPRACTPNTDLAFVAFAGRAVAEGTKVPVLELSGPWLRRWTRMIAGGPPETAAITVVGGHLSAPAVAAPRTLSAEQRVRQFRAAASGEAFTLARYVALSEPQLQIIRHVQTAMFRPAQPAHLAEVLLSGLLRVVDSGQGRYRFVEGVPEVLLETLTSSETIQARDLLEKVSASVQRQMAANRERFTVLTPGLGARRIGEESKPFAIISKLGSRRVALAGRRLDRPVPPAGATAPGESVPVGGAPPANGGEVSPLRIGSVDIAGLLTPEAAAIGFRGRDADLAVLSAWCTGGGASVFLLTGPAGTGKTRTARELLARKREDGWTATGRLLVVDRADVHRDQVAEALRSTGVPLRVLLTARAAGQWWHDQQAADSTGLLSEATVHELAPYCTESDQAEFVGRAVADLARLVLPAGSGSAATRVPPVLIRRGIASPLDIAVAAAWQLLGPQVTPAVDGVVERERRYAERSAVRAEISFATPAALDRYLAAAQLYGAEAASDARDVVRLVSGSQGRDATTVRRVATWLHELYPGTDGVYWSLLPDPVRDRLVLGAVPAATEIVRIMPALSVSQARRALASLVPACRRHPGLAEPVWAAAAESPALCAAVLEIARAAGGLSEPLLALARRTVAAPGTTVAVLRAVADGLDDVGVLFEGRTPEESELLAAAFGRLAGASAPHLPRFADAVYHCGLAGDRAGRYQEALRASATEIDLRRRVLTGAGGDERAVVALARALTIYAMRLDRAGSPVAGLAAAAEAVQLYERAGSGSDPAHALVEHSRLLGRLGRREEAWDSARRATARYRLLDDDAGLADALLAEAAHARSLGQAESAVAAGAEAVRCLERLGAADTERFAGRYAYACAVHGMDLGDFRSHQAGLDSLGRAAELYRALAARDPRQLPGLAAALTGRGLLLTECERTDEAGAAFAEVTEIYRGLARTEPAAYEQDLAGALTVQAEALAAGGRVDAAVDVMSEACRRLDRLQRADALDAGLRAELAGAYLILGGLHERRGEDAAARECRLRSRLLLGG